MIQAGANENRAAFRQMGERFDAVEHRLDRFGPDAVVVRAHSECAEHELSLILKRRSFELDSGRDKINVLAHRIRSEDLCHADKAVRANVLNWAARLHANQVETLPDAKQYRKMLLEVDPNADTRIIDAMIGEMEGDADSALQILRDIDDPDARTVMSVILYRSRSQEDMWAWFDEHPERDDPNFLTGVGWRNIALWLAQGGRWTEAATYLVNAHEHLDQCPDLIFVEGVISAAMLLPEEYRQYALEMNLFHPIIDTIEGLEADQIRERADGYFAHATDLMTELGENRLAQAARDWRLWLRLTDPRPEIVEAARREVQEGMRDGSRAVDLLDFARAFGIAFDDGPISRYLEHRKRFGGLEDRELAAEFLLAEITMAPQEFLTFLDREEGRLSQVVSKAIILGKRVEALVKDGQLARAREVLEERRSDFVDHDVGRLRALIDANEGEDIRGQLESLYQQTHSLIDLQNLCRYLGQVSDWTSLRPLLEELFRRERTTENALHLVSCMQRDLGTDFGDIAVVLNDQQDLVTQSHELASAQAWSFFQGGHWREAKAVNNRLLIERENPHDLDLDINLALQSGDWERFPVVIDREWPKRDEHGPNLLIRLAALAAEVDATSGRAFDLAKLAVSKAPDDLSVLMNAYLLAIQLGRDEDRDTARWFARTIELSSDTGPVFRANFRTVVEEMLPTQKENVHKVEQSLLHGEIPLHFAADALSQPMARILLDLPQRNVQQQDGRQRTLLPIVSGSRPPSPVEIYSDWTIGFDITSLLVLSHLELLNVALNTFQRVAITPNTMLFLFIERRRVRFHQPSLVREAEGIRSLIDRGRLKTMQSFPTPPQWLVNEVGQEFAQLLEAARTFNGRVVRDRPIYKLSTFMESEAELQEYDGLFLSTRALAQILLERGHIDSSTHERADQYLLAHERDDSVRTEGLRLDCPLYLDGLAMISFQRAGVLETVCNCDLDVLVHPATRGQQDNLIEANREGERLADRLGRIRTILRAALEEGKVVLLPQLGRAQDEGELDSFTKVASTLFHFLGDIGSCNAICIDDRFVNKYLTLTDQRTRTVPVICVLDLLRLFQSQNVITENQRYEKLHRLRRSGFILVPVELDELEKHLRDAGIDQEGHLIENAELRILRQTLMRIRSLDIVQQPMENPFLDRLRFGSIIVIRQLWQNNDVSAEQAVAQSDWVWRNVAPSPLDWAYPVRDRSNIASQLDAFARHIALLLNPMSIGNGERYKIFRDWVEHAVLEPLLPVNADLIDRVATLIGTHIEALSMEHGGHADHASG
jgi:hypothetical protein